MTISGRSRGGLGASWSDLKAPWSDIETYLGDLGAVLAAVGGTLKNHRLSLFFNDSLSFGECLEGGLGIPGGILCLLGAILG